MIIEIRTYRVKPGRRADFIRFFETKAAPAQRALGMRILGPMLDLEKPDVFHWLRAFPTMEAREAMRSAFYGGTVFKNELEPEAKSMLESDEMSLAETLPGFPSF